jgi:lipase
MERTMTTNPFGEPRMVPVAGGTLAVGDTGGDGPVVLAAHGVTASHMEWPAIARALGDHRILAPDLRGRGRSRDLPGPWGMRQHAEDLERVLDDAGVEKALVLGHSMGAFVAVAFADRAPDRVSALVLVDGGFPLDRPAGISDEDLPAAVLGPAAQRLGMTFPDRDAYRAFWDGHPAFAGEWNDDVLAYIDYDLVEADGALRPASRVDAVAQDGLELYDPAWYRDALRNLRMPVTVLRAPLGLMAEPPGLYPPGKLDAAVDHVPQLRVIEVPDVNHYTIAMTDRGAAAVADAVRAAERSAAGTDGGERA